MISTKNTTSLRKNSPRFETAALTLSNEVIRKMNCFHLSRGLKVKPKTLRQQNRNLIYIFFFHLSIKEKL